MNENKQPVENEVDKFFTELPEKDKEEVNFLDELNEPSKKPTMKDQDEDPEKAPDEVKNRRHRRLEEKLKRERESNIALNERIKALSEVTKVSATEEIDPRLLKIFGTTQLGLQISKEFASILNEQKKAAREDVIRQLEAERQAQIEEEQHFDDIVESNLEDIEDKYGIDITSDRPAAVELRTRLLQRVEELSPKNEAGELTDYANFGATYEMMRNEFQTQQQSAARSKQLASRQMPRSSSAPAQKKQTPGFFGWKKDYGME